MSQSKRSFKQMLSILTSSYRVRIQLACCILVGL